MAHELLQGHKSLAPLKRFAWGARRWDSSEQPRGIMFAPCEGLMYGWPIVRATAVDTCNQEGKCVTSAPSESWPTFQVATDVVFGIGAIEMIGSRTSALGIRKVMLVTGNVTGRSDGVQRAMDALHESGLSTFFWDGVDREPTDKLIVEGIRAYKAEACDGLIAFGGGSTIDSAKAIGVLALSGGHDPADYQPGGTGTVAGSAPLVAVPTTAGSGSEVTQVSIITNTRRNRKLGIRHPSLRPKVAIVDPSLTASMPPSVTMATGVDALSHAVECFTRPREHPLADSLALEAIRLIGSNLQQSVEHGEDTDARTNMAMAATMAGAAFDSGGLQFHTHAMILGAEYRIPHGIACGICLRAGLRQILPTATRKLARMGCALGIDVSGLSEPEAAERSLDAAIELLDRLDVPQARELVGSTPVDIPSLVEEVLSLTAIPMSRETASAIWEGVFG